MKFEQIETRLEAILDRELSLGHQRLRVRGSSSALNLALVLCNNTSKKISGLPHLVVVPRMSDALRLQQCLAFFNPSHQSEILPHFDVSPYVGLYPRDRSIAERLRFLWMAQSAKPNQIFIAPIGSLLQKTLPFRALSENSHTFGVGAELPDGLSEFLSQIGYQSAPLVEDVGQFAIRGGIVDIFSPAHALPVRIELFGDQVESLRFFSPTDQRSQDPVTEFHLIPCREYLWKEADVESLVSSFRKTVEGRSVDQSEYEEALRHLSRKTSFPGIDFLLPFFFKQVESPLNHFCSDLNVWFIDPMEISRHADQIFAEMKSDFDLSSKQVVRPPISSLYGSLDDLAFSGESSQIELTTLDLDEAGTSGDQFYKIDYRSAPVHELANQLHAQLPGSEAWLSALKSKIGAWRQGGYRIFVGVKNKSQIERLRIFFEKIDLKIVVPEPADLFWHSWLEDQDRDLHLIHVLPTLLPESLRLEDEQLVFLRDEDLLGKKIRSGTTTTSKEDFQTKAKRLSFGDLKPGDCVVHVLHGIGVYDGLKIMSINGVESEFIQISYKDKDKLYLPVYRVGQIQKYSGLAQTAPLDKLGGTSWEKTKTKVRGHLRDIASELLELYAKRAEMHRPALRLDENAFASFEMGFPYDETDDQLRSIRDIVHDFTHTKPMDRLICGDVGFGKTEIAMRATFLAAHNKKQVAVLAPTTVLSFQHYETFKKRFAGWNFEIRELNRFVSNADAKKTIAELKEGKVDILIGTHRLLSKDVVFKDLGLLIVDEEQKFGVAHKEKIRKLRTGVDTLAMSATPIPRTLNMSLVGIRDLSLINTAPVDRLPTRTFISKWDDESIRKAISSEISRGGQVYFIHNRVQSIYSIADRVRSLVPEARIKIGHGQMNEDELEKTMVQFFHREIDVLICTTIVESGMDVPTANTMFIDDAHMMGLSQLYQLRGRVGRSKQRAYCYLILPKDKKIDKDAQERLRVIQENTALGSGIRVAQYDLELRGAGDLLGEEQSGHINAVGYELYMDLLEEAIHQLKGEPSDDATVDPEINLRIPALIPDKYIADIRLRLTYYKALSEIRSHEDLEKIEEELRDQFGEIPEPTLNLMGLMLIRAQCKDLGVRDLSAGLKNISLIFTEKTKLKPETVISLAMKENKKYSLTPDNRLNIRMNNITWPGVYEELSYLLKLI